MGFLNRALESRRVWDVEKIKFLSRDLGAVTGDKGGVYDKRLACRRGVRKEFLSYIFEYHNIQFSTMRNQRVFRHGMDNDVGVYFGIYIDNFNLILLSDPV